MCRGGVAMLQAALLLTALSKADVAFIHDRGRRCGFAGEVTGLGPYEAVKAYAEEVELYEHRIWGLTLAGLIVSKQAAGRAKDLRLLPELQALQALRGAPREDGP